MLIATEQAHDRRDAFMIANIQVADEIQKIYAEFLETQQHPKLEQLNNWGKNRYFLSKYFSVDYGQCKSEKITILFNARSYCLDTRLAPDFMDHDKYVEWLISTLLK